MTSPSPTDPSDSAATPPVALVTGASRGLGFLIARELAGRGFDLIVNARSEDGLAAAAADLQTAGGQVVAVPGDVGVPGDAQLLVQTAVDRFGRLDLLVANAGVIQVGPATAMRTEDFRLAMDVMFWGVLHPALAALPLLQQTRGRILVVTSVGGKIPAPHLLPYSTAKHAAVAFAEGLRVEAHRLGVTVTVAVPGLMRTGSPRNALFTGDRTAEHRWFALADSIPVLSMDAERAAAALVRATLRGRAEVVLTPAAKLAVRLHGVAPASTLRLLSLVERLLPADGTRTAVAPGHQVAGRGRIFRGLTRLSERAAQRNHEYTDPTTTTDGGSA